MFDIKIEEISQKTLTNEGTFLQTPFWCEFKSRHGWKNYYYAVTVKYPDEEDDGHCENNNKTRPEKLLEKFEISVLVRSFAKGKYSIAYVPLMPGPLFKCTDKDTIEKLLAFYDKEEESEEFDDVQDSEIEVIQEELVTPETQTIELAHFMNELAFALKSYLPENTMVLRFDPDLVFYTPSDRDYFNKGMKLVSFADKLKLKKNKVDIQPPDSTLVDLTKTEEEILEKMHSKWRYNIRLAERKGVVVKRYLGDDEKIQDKIDRFYELTKETNARDGNSSHAKSYYLDLIQSSAEKRNNREDVPVVSLYIAEHEGEEIASIMTLFTKTESIYLYGASSNHKRNLMPNHLLQWNAMKDAKIFGSTFYDMYGMPPEGKNENHPMHGLYMFKVNFGGTNIHRTGSWDVPFKFIYKFYRLAENFRAFWYKKIIKKFKGR